MAAAADHLALVSLPLAHFGHWYESVLFVLPIVVIGAVIWYSVRKEKAAGGDWDDEWDDPRLRDDDEWDDPRLRDD